MDFSLSRRASSSLSIIRDRTFTSLNGINAQGYITGRYLDAAGAQHGILAKVNLEGKQDKTNTLAAPVIKPALPARSGLAAPAM